MRCPKCGYFSFDHLESCKKCGKDLSRIAAELDGTVYDVLPPVYLHLDLDGPDQADTLEEPDQLPEEEEAAELLNDAPPLAGDEKSEPAADDSAEEDDLAEEEIPFEESLEELEEVVGEEEHTVEFQALQAEEEGALASEADPPSLEEEQEELEEGDITLPKIDFENLDISDLGPDAPAVEPEMDEETLTAEALNLERELGLTDEEAQVEPQAETNQAGEEPSLTRLEDLQLDGLDLETTAMAASLKKKGGKHLKTGTALDDFNIDISEFLSGEKE